MARKTIYVFVNDRKGRPLGRAALRRLATTVLAYIPPRYFDRYYGDYVAAGTSLRPEVTGIPHTDGEPYVSVPLLKVRGNDVGRDLAISGILRAGNRIAAIRDHKGNLIGGRR